MAFFQYLGLFLCNVANTYSVQKYSRSSQGYAEIFVYTILTGLIAMVTFYVTSGFCLRWNPRTLLYALIFAVIVIVIHVTNLLSMRFLHITEAILCSNSLSLILSLLSGWLLFSERIRLTAVARVLLMLAATFLAIKSPGVPATHRLSFNRFFFIGILLRCVTALASTASTVVNKYFALDPGVTDSHSFFFMTNLLITVFSLVFLLLFCRGQLSACVRQFKNQKPSQYAAIGLNTFSSNLSSLLNVQILKHGSLSLYTPVSGALGILATETVAVWAAREKPKTAAMLLAVCAMLLSFFE